MEKVALYRKYRPSNFDQVYGQKVIVKALESAIKNNEIIHSYIFAGNKGSGKTTLAKIFSKAINCLQLENNYNPCNKCANCLAIDNATTMDFLELDAASNSGVNEVRTIIESVKYMPTELKYKVYIIDEAHMLTNSSWNALLKTIEEPPHYVVFIFATTEYHKIPATIISRCQRYDFHKISLNDLKELITTVAKKENVKITNESIEAIAKMSDGAARDSLSILDQLVNYDNKEINYNSISTLFGTLSIETKISFLNNVYNQQQEEIINTINNYDASGINFDNLVNDLLEILMDKIIYLRTNNDKLLHALNKKQLERLLINDEKLLMFYIDVLVDCSKKIRQYINPKFCFEYVAIKMLEKQIPNNANCYSVQQHSTNQNTTKSNSNATNSANKSDATNSTNIDLASNQVIKTKSEIENINKVFSTKDITSTYLNNNLNNQQTITKPIDDNNEKINKWKLLSEKKQEIKSSIDEIQKLKQEINQDKEQQVNLDYIKPEVEKFDCYNDEFKKDFFSIAANKNSEQLEKFNTIFSKLKDLGSIYSQPIKSLMDANKFLIVSENGAILVFDSKSQSFRFNSKKHDKKITDFFYEKFGCEKLLLGIDKNQVLIYKEEYKKIDKKEYKDVKINKNKENTKTKLIELLNSYDKE